MHRGGRSTPAAPSALQCTSLLLHQFAAALHCCVSTHQPLPAQCTAHLVLQSRPPILFPPTQHPPPPSPAHPPTQHLPPLQWDAAVKEFTSGLKCVSNSRQEADLLVRRSTALTRYVFFLGGGAIVCAYLYLLSAQTLVASWLVVSAHETSTQVGSCTQHQPCRPSWLTLLRECPCWKGSEGSDHHRAPPPTVSINHADLAGSHY